MKSTSRLFSCLLLALASTLAQADTSLLNASYDVSRDYYKDYNPLFQRYWKAKTGETLEIKQSHGGSSKQVRAVADGLEADVVSMNQPIDIEYLVERGLVAKDWTKKFANNAAPFSSVTVFIVRKGNPKKIRDWADLGTPGKQIIIPSPKTSGNACASYLAAWSWAQLQPGGSETSARDFVSRLIRNIPLFAAGGRDATTTFMQRGIGDVLITFESEAELIAKEFGRGEFDVVYPSLTLRSDFPVAVVDSVVDKKGCRKQAQAYLDYLWSKEGQETAAENYLRPRDPQILKKYAATFPAVKSVTVDEVFGSVSKAWATHFRDGGVFDQIAVGSK